MGQIRRANSSSRVRIESVGIQDSGSFSPSSHNNASGGILLEEGTHDVENPQVHHPPRAGWWGRPGENSTVWDSPSPKFIMGGSAEDKYDHPTQKPVELVRRPIRNHLKRGESVYDPFLRSGTALAAELTERACYGMELDPKYVDVIVQRWQGLSGEAVVLDGDGRNFDEIAVERHKGSGDLEPGT